MGLRALGGLSCSSSGAFSISRSARGTAMTLVLRHAAQLVRVAQKRERIKCGPAQAELSLLEDAALILREGRIDWLGPDAELPRVAEEVEVIDASGKIV